MFDQNNEIFTDHYLATLYVLRMNKCVVISLDSSTATNIKLNGNTAGFFPMLSKMNLQVNLQRTTRRYL